MSGRRLSRGRPRDFAVATEAFFEKPWQMRKREPELYEQLSQFYRQDPALLPPSSTSGGDV